jgi:hypothetical protein
VGYVRRYYVVALCSSFTYDISHCVFFIFITVTALNVYSSLRNVTNKLHEQNLLSVRNIPLHCKNTSGSFRRWGERRLSKSTYMHRNIYKRDAQNLLFVHLDCATQWKQLWYNLLTSKDTKLHHQLGNIYRLVGDVVHLLCMYSSAGKVGFISWFLQFALYTKYENLLSIVKFQFFRSALQEVCEGGLSEVTYCIYVSSANMCILIRYYIYWLKLSFDLMAVVHTPVQKSKSRSRRKEKQYRSQHTQNNRDYRIKTIITT